MTGRLLLHRGIHLDPGSAAADITAIRATGQIGRAGGYVFAAPAGRALAAVHAAEPARFRDALSALPMGDVTYGCGDRDGAARYARLGKGAPFLISFEVDPEEAIIDGRDFLYTVFQFWDRSGVAHLDLVRRRLDDLFGGAVLARFDAARGTDDQQERIGFCDLAVHDLAGIRDHHCNQTTIAGRVGTLFRSAFCVPAILPPARILAIEPIGGPPPPPAEIVSLRDLVP